MAADQTLDSRGSFSSLTEQTEKGISVSCYVIGEKSPKKGGLRTAVIYSEVN